MLCLFDNSHAETVSRSIRTFSLLARRKVLWCIGARSAHEEQSPIRQRNIASIRSQSSVFCTVAVHDNDSAGSQGFLGEPRSYQRAGRSGFDRPVLNISVRLFDIDEDP